MGKRGPAKRPLALATLHGETRPSRVNLNEPVPDEGEVAPPDWLGHRALEIWMRLAPDLKAKGVLTPWDVDSFASFCAAVVVNQDALRNIEDNGTSVTTPVRELTDGTIIYELRKNPAWQIARESTAIMVTMGGRFGLNPSDRTQLTMKPDEDTGKGADRLLG